jgi:uncharacterized membrane protein
MTSTARANRKRADKETSLGAAGKVITVVSYYIVIIISLLRLYVLLEEPGCAVAVLWRVLQKQCNPASR